MEMEWSLDYCLTCDRQTTGEAYCSQICRLADLETSSCGSEPPSPTRTHTPNSGLPAGPGPSNGFVLPPAFDFAAYRRSSPSPNHSRPSSSYFSSNATASSTSRSSASPRVLTPSSSHASLNSSTTSVNLTESISSQARTELRDYTSSFDQVRDLRRRMTTS